MLRNRRNGFPVLFLILILLLVAFGFILGLWSSSLFGQKEDGRESLSPTLDLVAGSEDGLFSETLHEQETKKDQVTEQEMAPKSTIEPTMAPKPTVEPTMAPKPTIEPTMTPKPTIEPTMTPKPTIEPTMTPKPTVEPTMTPTPTVEPTMTPTPTIEPSMTPKPTVEPTKTPVRTAAPTEEPQIQVPDMGDINEQRFNAPLIGRSMTITVVLGDASASSVTVVCPDGSILSGSQQGNTFTFYATSESGTYVVKTVGYSSAGSVAVSVHCQ